MARRNRYPPRHRGRSEGEAGAGVRSALVRWRRGTRGRAREKREHECQSNNHHCYHEEEEDDAKEERKEKTASARRLGDARRTARPRCPRYRGGGGRRRGESWCPSTATALRRRAYAVRCRASYVPSHSPPFVRVRITCSSRERNCASAASRRSAAARRPSARWLSANPPRGPNDPMRLGRAGRYRQTTAPYLLLRSSNSSAADERHELPQLA